MRRILVLTPMYGPAVQCKRTRRSWRCGLASMYQASDWSVAPGHHGYQRACDLISGQASNGLFGSPVFACAGKTDHSIVVSSSRRPRRVTLVKLSASTFLASCCSFVCAGGRSFVPACGCTGAPRAGPVKAGRRDNIATCASVCRPRLDGPEHGARIKQIGTLLHWP